MLLYVVLFYKGDMVALGVCFRGFCLNMNDGTLFVLSWVGYDGFLWLVLIRNDAR